MRVNGSLSLGQIAVHISNGENNFYFYNRRKEEITTLFIDALNSNDFLNIHEHSFMRDKYISVNDEIILFGKFYDKKLRIGHIFFFEHHLNDYANSRI